MPGYRGGYHGYHKKPHGAPVGEIRLRVPRPGEIMSIVVSLSGGSRMVVHCEDGKERMARIPGKIRNKIWVREGDYVLVVPWTVEGDKKCDIAFRYTAVQADILKQKGIIKM